MSPLFWKQKGLTNLDMKIPGFLKNEEWKYKESNGKKSSF